MADNKEFRYILENQVKTALRLSTDFFDNNEIHPMINACLIDMKGAGVDIDAEDKFLISQAVVFYCKANFGLEANEKWQQQYEKTRDAMASRVTGVTE